jgi:MoxR-like ATPase
VEDTIVGKSDVVRLAVLCLLAEGHLLIEDVPGVGKTSLARALADAVSGSTRRIQFTPDLLPTDITGTVVYRPGAEPEIRPGPVFANIVLCDEVNRASPKTQSALLQVMEERQVTIDREDLAVPSPFMVIATQNPVEMAGTYPLPEAQLDRFLIRLRIGYPDLAAEAAMLREQRAPDFPGPRARPAGSMSPV